MILPAGYDSTAEAGWVNVPAALEYGYCVLLFEGPGQGASLFRDRLFLRPDFEAVLTPVLDWLIEQLEVDANTFGAGRPLLWRMSRARGSLRPPDRGPRLRSRPARVNAFGSRKHGQTEILTYLEGLLADDNFNAGSLIALPGSHIRVSTDDVVLVWPIVFEMHMDANQEPTYANHT